MPKNKFTAKTLTSCALLIAMSVLLARLFSLLPNAHSRFSLESVPILLSGILFGPLPGALVGFASDFIGCQFSPFGYNPILSLPPVIYGICGGLFSPMLKKHMKFLTVFITVAVPAVFGSMLWQSFALDLVYGTGFIPTLTARALQFSAVIVLDSLVIKLLFYSNMFYRLGLWKDLK